ncbi:MAG: hypothetical protein ABIH23_31700 [bacterium]
MSTERRFLRDLILDKMLSDLRDIQGRAETDEQFKICNMDPILEASVNLLETSKTVLEHIESAIERIRTDPAQLDQLDSLTMAAAHLRIGITAMHTSLVESSGESTPDDPEQ